MAEQMLRQNRKHMKLLYRESLQQVICISGQSLVVWAIREGREAARAVDESLMGYTNL